MRYRTLVAVWDGAAAGKGRKEGKRGGGLFFAIDWQVIGDEIENSICIGLDT